MNLADALAEQGLEAFNRHWGRGARAMHHARTKGDVLVVQRPVLDLLLEARELLGRCGLFVLAGKSASRDELLADLNAFAAKLEGLEK